VGADLRDSLERLENALLRAKAPEKREPKRRSRSVVKRDPETQAILCVVVETSDGRTFARLPERDADGRIVAFSTTEV
jgi:hypothetical protein